MTEISSPQIEIVAELAQGFEGKPAQAEFLLRAAAAAGADAAKFQLVYADELATPDYKYYELFKSLEMPDSVWTELFAVSRKQGIGLYLDVFGARSLKLAESLGVSAVKLHGTDIANIGFLETVAAGSIPGVMLGAGGATEPEIDRAVRLLAGKKIVVLLGFQAYPTPNDTNQIARVRVLADRYAATEEGVTIGFADHAPPEDATRFALAATALGAGALVFEKHLTLARNMKLEDYESALNPDEFASFCDVIRASAAAFGRCKTGVDFGMSAAESGYRTMIRRHVVTTRELVAGSRIAPSDVTLKRSAVDAPITDLENVYGKMLGRALAANTPIERHDLHEGERS